LKEREKKRRRTGLQRKKRRLSYPWGHLLSALLMLYIVGLTEDIVSSVFNSRGFIVPVRALVAGLVVYMNPDFWRRRDQHPRCDTGDRTCLAARLLAGGREKNTAVKMPIRQGL
jgi:hypothetical protein